MTRLSITRALGLILAAAWFAWAGASPAGAQTVIPPFDRVEEDWELVIDQPDLMAEGPQITTTMSPLGDLGGQFIAFNLNYRSQPSYLPGGLELVSYDGERVLATSSQGTSRLATTGETVTWTQSLQISGGVIVYDIKQGDSTTWSGFGQGSGANLGIQAATSLGSMDGYSPSASVANSGPGWQSNRVSSMRMLRVRYYNGGQLVLVDETPRPVELGL
ncbi:hypothetical protein [Tautonia plasticadhaerens]|uniref:Uncharacterized protein n=1 Tax=Tautonia plasticadhaerens TaxID=2527974 RepID=A0A518H551_9BACT|nr:hypothetical protein [Tautonia plasticadhaerens]QDV35957.1 hypothetical protein ElP_38670 [Tautonia plasticadhaerens]